MANTSTATVATYLDDLLSIGGSVSLYMVKVQRVRSLPAPQDPSPTPTAPSIDGLRHALTSADASFSMWFFVLCLLQGHGGTNWGLWSGANGGGTSYQPHITSCVPLCVALAQWTCTFVFLFMTPPPPVLSLCSLCAATTTTAPSVRVANTDMAQMGTSTQLCRCGWG